MSQEAREFTGLSATEAAINACEEFGVNRSDIEYEVISETGEGLDKQVVIQAKLKEGVQLGAANHESDDGQDNDSARESRSRTNRREARGGRDRDRGGRGRERNGRGRDRDRSSRSSREKATNIEEMIELKPLPEEAVEIPQGFEGDASERALKAIDALTDILKHAKIDVKAVLVDDTEDQIEISMHGSDEERVIGKSGEVLLAFQFIINRVVSRATEGEQLIVLDAADYRGRRKAALEELARSLAKKAEKNSRIVKLSPMSSHDRRVVHQALNDFKGVSTKSEGEGIFRHLLIIPADYKKRDRAPAQN